MNFVISNYGFTSVLRCPISLAACAGTARAGDVETPLVEVLSTIGP
jgi:hypothetical protein